MVIVTQNIRRTDNICHLTCRIIFQCIRSQCKLRVYQFHIIIEDRLFSTGIILSPLRSQHILLIHQGSSVEEISQIIYTVIIQAICQQGRITILHTHIHTYFSYLCITIVIQAVAIQEKRISLIHLHIAECLKRTDLIVIISTVAIHIHTVVTENNISHHNLSIRISGILTQQIGMYQINFTFRRLFLRSGLSLSYFSRIFRSLLHTTLYRFLCQQTKAEQA